MDRQELILQAEMALQDYEKAVEQVRYRTHPLHVWSLLIANEMHYGLCKFFNREYPALLEPFGIWYRKRYYTNYYERTPYSARGAAKMKSRHKMRIYLLKSFIFHLEYDV